VLLTTQYLNEAEQLADRIAILHEGRIIVIWALWAMHWFLRTTYRDILRNLYYDAERDQIFAGNAQELFKL